MPKAADVVVVGGGVAGSTLGRALALHGLGVLVLERTRAFEDRVRGEWMAPWGVAEAMRLGIYDLLRELGGHHITRHVLYDEAIPADFAEAHAIPLGVWLPDVPGPLTIEHVVMQQGLLDASREAGAEVVRGVAGVRVEAGAAPRVSFSDGGGEREVTCHLVVGADGRASAVRRQLGIALREDPVDHLIAGLLIDGLAEWPEEQQALGKAGDIHFLIFPQGRGKARLYADYDAGGRGRFAGEDGARRFLDCFELECVPGSAEIARAAPIGPCRSYPSQDAWTEVPVVEGAVLVGDAAGYNDPIIGQGLSIALRDVRMVRDLLCGNAAWCAELLAPYVEERLERLRRLRFVAQLVTRLNARFDPESVEARQRALARLAESPSLVPRVLGGVFAGPESLAAADVSPEFAEFLFGA